MTIFESQISTPVPMPMRMTPFKRFKKTPNIVHENQCRYRS